MPFMKRFPIALLVVLGLVVSVVAQAQSAAAATNGVASGPVPKGPQEAANFEAWLGASVPLASEFLNRTSWSEISNPNSIPYWSSWARNRPGRNLVLAVPMLAGSDPSFPSTSAQDGETSWQLQQGASGAWDWHFRTLADRLVAAGLSGTILRIGWEHHGHWYRWRSRPNPGAWASYYRRIVDVMRGAPGQQFKFVWNPGVGIGEWYNGKPYYADSTYPGDWHVDWVGVNIFDYSWGHYPYPWGASDGDRAWRQQSAWNELAWGDHGLNHWQSFANSHGKALVLPEWGVQTRTDGHGGGDNPYFVERIHEWITTRGVPWHIYYNMDGPDARASLSNFPNSANRFKQLFGAGIAIGQGATNPWAYVDAVNRAGGEYAMGRPFNTAHTWGPGCIQDFSGGQRVRSAVMSRGCGGATHAVTAHHWSYLEGNYGASAADVVGYPTNDSHRWGNGWAQDFDGGQHGWNIVMLADGAWDRPAVAVRGGLRERYLSMGGPTGYLGYPTTNEYWWNGTFYQHFQGGTLTLP